MERTKVEASERCRYRIRKVRFDIGSRQAVGFTEAGRFWEVVNRREAVGFRHILGVVKTTLGPAMSRFQLISTVFRRVLYLEVQVKEGRPSNQPGKADLPARSAGEGDLSTI
jgi:hypothetical protein